MDNNDLYTGTIVNSDEMDDRILAAAGEWTSDDLGTATTDDGFWSENTIAGTQVG